MKELIAIQKSAIGEGTVNTVNARDLHSFLDVKRQFSKWIDDQVGRARLLEGRDFIKVVEKDYLSKTGQTKTEYFLTIEAGKHIAMLSGTEKGFEVREYFIECEKRAQAAPAFKLPGTFKEALLHLVEQVDQNEKLQLTIAEQAPKVELANRIERAQAISIEKYVKAISGRDGIVIGRNNFFAWMRKEKLIDKRNMPYQQYIDAGWFEVREGTYENIASNGPRACFTTLIAGKGQVAIFERLKTSPHTVDFVNKRARLQAKQTIEVRPCH